jgi:hypothetical protein
MDEYKVEITRYPNNPEIFGYHFVSWNHALSVLGISDFISNTILSDLSQGAWKGHWIAHELQHQLGITDDTFIQPLLNNGNYADTVAKLIDNESEGDKNFILALKHCIKIKQKLIEEKIQYVILIAPESEMDWEDENLQFINILSDALKGTAIRIVLFLTNKANVPKDWNIQYLNTQNSTAYFSPLVPFYPGIIEKKKVDYLVNHKESFVELRNGLAAVNPLLRASLSQENELNSSWLDKPYLKVAKYSQYNEDISREEVEKEAILRFAEGGYGIALRLLSNLLSKVIDPYERALIIGQMQNMRIALLRFSDAANEELPNEELPDIMKASLYQSKAWGLVMNNKPVEAEPYFEKARNYLNEKEFSRLYLYLLNISALNKLRIGEIETAFAFEKRIEDSLNNQPERDWHITYINNINQARLYKKIKDFDMSESYYNRAFSINIQLKNESDLLYTNLCYAQLEELKGNFARSFLFYLRTCIHWLSNPTPEALAPRVAQAILNKGLSSAKGNVEAISEKLKTNLLDLANKNKIQLYENINPNFINFIRSENALTSSRLLVGDNGWSVCLSEYQTVPAYSGSEYDSLKSIILSYIQSCFPNVQWANYKSIITDTQFSCELPSTWTEALIVAWRLNISELLFNQKRVILKENDIINLKSKIKVGISPAIDYITYEEKRMKVFYRRYKSPQLLDDSETKMMVDLQTIKSVTFSELGDEHVIRELEKKRLIQLYY